MKMVRVLAALSMLGGCSGVDFGDNPSREVSKETGPLTVPPAGLRNGTSR